MRSNPHFTNVKDLKEGYWVVLRLMRLGSPHTGFASSPEFVRTSEWLMERMTVEVFRDAIALLEKEERSHAG